MKSTLFAVIVVAVGLNIANAGVDDFSLVASYGHLSGFDAAYLHNTHPGDAFLPGSNVPGSAGKTEVDTLDFAQIGFRYQRELVAKTIFFNIDAGGLIGTAEDRKQNANDNRPAGSGAFVYSDANFGFFVGAGVTYHPESMKGFYFGVSAQTHCVFVDHGWDRFGSRTSVKKETLWLPSVGPKVGYQISENAAIELAAQFGKANGGTLSLIWQF